MKHVMIRLDDETFKKAKVWLAKNGLTWQDWLSGKIKTEIKNPSLNKIKSD